MNPTLHKAANGHLSLDFNELSDACWLSIAEELIKLRGFKRVGSPVIGVSDQIHQNFQCAEFNLADGWDNWSGHYLLERLRMAVMDRFQPVATGRKRPEADAQEAPNGCEAATDT